MKIKLTKKIIMADGSRLLGFTDSSRTCYYGRNNKDRAFTIRKELV